MPSQITPFLWFDSQAEEAAAFYTSVFKSSKIMQTQRYTSAGTETHGQTPGSVMLVTFELNGQLFTALNGGPHYKFNPAVSFQIKCADQAEVDYYWDKLAEGGDPTAQRCGWVQDKFGLSWQVVPTALAEIMARGDGEASKRAFGAMMGMKKLDIATLERAYHEG